LSIKQEGTEKFYVLNSKQSHLLLFTDLVSSVCYTEGRGIEELVCNLSKRSNAKETLKIVKVTWQNCKVIHNNLQS